MTDTIKTKQQLITAFNDNITRAIVPQTHRDNIVSQMSCTAQIHTPAAPLVIGLAAAPITFSAQTSESGGLTVDPAWAYIDIATGGDGIYLFGFSIDFITNIANNTKVWVGLYLNAAAVYEVEFNATNPAGDLQTGGSFLTGQLVATDRVQLGIRAAAAGTIAWNSGYIYLSRQASTPITP